MERYVENLIDEEVNNFGLDLNPETQISENYNSDIVAVGENLDIEKLENFENVRKISMEKFAFEIGSSLDDLYRTNRPPKKLADLHTKLVKKIYSESLETGDGLDSSIKKVLSNLIKLIQAGLRVGEYSFTNEFLFEQLGFSRERGIAADLEFISSLEKLPKNIIRHIYSNSLLDNTFSIDYIIDTYNLLSKERVVELVQVKNNLNRIDKRDRDQIVLKHKRFRKDFKLMTHETVIKKVEEKELESFEKMIDATFVDDIIYKFFCVQFEVEDHDSIFMQKEIFNSYKTWLTSQEFYKKAPNNIKYEHIKKIDTLTDFDLSEERGVLLSKDFNTLKNEWLNEIKVKKDDLYKPILNAKYKTIIFGGGEKEEITIE